MRLFALPLLLLPAAALAAPAPGPDEKLAMIASQVSADSLKATVAKLVNFGTRHTLSSQTDKKRGIGAALDWTESEFKKLKLETVRPCDTVTGRRVPTPTRVCDMVAIQRGTERPNDVVIIQGHIDSRVSDVMNSPPTRPAPTTTAPASPR